MNTNILEDIIKILKFNPVIPCTDFYDEIFSVKYKNIKIVYLYDLGIPDLLDITKKIKT